MTKEEIIKKVNDIHLSFAEVVSTFNEQQFNTAPKGKWTVGQQLEHLYKSIAPLTMAFGLPKLSVKVLMGKAKHPSRDFDGLVAFYNQALANGGVAPAGYAPKEVPFADRDELIAKVKKNLAKFSNNLSTYTEDELDIYRLPHPLIGKITMREMLYFTIYHSQHHYDVAMGNLGR